MNWTGGRTCPADVVRPSLCGSDADVTLPIVRPPTVELSTRRPVAPLWTEHGAGDRVAGQVAPRAGRDVDVAVIRVASIWASLHSKPAEPGVAGTLAVVEIRWSVASASPTRSSACPGRGPSAGRPATSARATAAPMCSVTFVHGRPALFAGTSTRSNWASERTAYCTPAAGLSGGADVGLDDVGARDRVAVADAAPSRPGRRRPSASPPASPTTSCPASRSPSRTGRSRTGTAA